MTEFEDFATAKVLAGRSIVGLYPPTDEKIVQEFEAIKSRKSK